MLDAPERAGARGRAFSIPRARAPSRSEDRVSKETTRTARASARALPSLRARSLCVDAARARALAPFEVFAQHVERSPHDEPLGAQEAQQHELLRLAERPARDVVAALGEQRLELVQRLLVARREVRPVPVGAVAVRERVVRVDRPVRRVVARVVGHRAAARAEAAGRVRFFRGGGGRGAARDDETWSRNLDTGKEAGVSERAVDCDE